MSVLDGPRQEWRRILHEGQPKWVRPDGDRLVLGDGRDIADAEATYLPPCDPTKILCIHLNYDSRRVEFKAPMLETPTYFQKPVTALNSHRGVLCRPGGTQVSQLRGRSRRHHRQADAQRQPRRRVGLYRRIRARQRCRMPGLPRHRCRLDAPRKGPGRLLSDRSRNRQWRGYSQIHFAYLHQRQDGPGGINFGNAISD